MPLVYFFKQQRFNAVRKSITDAGSGIEYTALFHYTAGRRLAKVEMVFRYYPCGRKILFQLTQVGLFYK